MAYRQYAYCEVTTVSGQLEPGGIMSGKGGKPRKHPGVRGRRPDRKATRQLEANERQARYDTDKALELAQRLGASTELLGEISKVRAKARKR